MILIALGANLPGRYGSPEQTLNRALRELNDRNIRVRRCSRFWLTAPVPASDQPWFTNAVAAVETGLDPYELVRLLKIIEMDFGRAFDTKNAARILDLDLLAYNDEIVRVDNLVVPHPRMHERAFVLYPLQEIAPKWVHPGLKLTVDELIENMPSGQLLKVLEKAA